MKNIIFILLFCVPLQLFAQLQNQDLEVNDSCFWFQLKVEDYIMRNSREHVYRVTEVSKHTMQGLKDDFIRNLKAFIDRNKILIGPFGNYSSAELARALYKKASYSSIEELEEYIKKSEAINDECFFFNMDIGYRKGSLYFKQIPKRVSPGSISQFKEFALVSLIYRKLTNGPYKTQKAAEEAKKILEAMENNN